MNQMNIFYQTMMILILCLCCQSASAISLAQAKAQGLIGERQNGYVGIVVNEPPAEVPILVNDVNGKRRQEYIRIAQQRGVDVSQVELLAGQRAIEQTPPGQHVEINGRWMQK